MIFSLLLIALSKRRCMSTSTFSIVGLVDADTAAAAASSYSRNLFYSLRRFSIYSMSV